MARKIRFPLRMKNGAEVRTLDELKENFDLESVLGYFTDGKLQTWLADRYYDEKAEAVAGLSLNMPDLNARLCAILEVEYRAAEGSTNIKEIQRRQEKLRILSALTDSRDILDNIDNVARTQNELNRILKNKPEKVYLYGEMFGIPLSSDNVCYIGIGSKMPSIALERNTGLNDYSNKGISFKNIDLGDNLVKLADQLYKDKKYKEAFPILLKLATNGDKNNQARVGWMYETGNGVDKDYSKAVEWYTKAAEQGVAWAQNNLGWLYRKGLGVSQDYVKAVEWYRKAAEQGNSDSQNRLGFMYDNGYGIEKDKTKAVEWYRKAANQGHDTAQCNLAWMYENGQGIIKDLVEAAKWYRKAADQGNKTAQCNLGNCYADGKGVNCNYTEAAKWYRKAAEQGNKNAQYNLGNCYADGKGVNCNYTEAAKWYEKASEQGHIDAKNRLADLYYEGNGVSRDYNKAAKLYQIAAASKNYYAMYKLGGMYINGKGLAKDIEKGASMIIEAANHNNENAINYLGFSILGFQMEFNERLIGLISQESEVNAAKRNLKALKNEFESKDVFKLIKKAAEAGNDKAQFLVATIYEDPEDKIRNAESIKWLKLSAAQGCEEAKLGLELKGINLQ